MWYFLAINTPFDLNFPPNSSNKYQVGSYLIKYKYNACLFNIIYRYCFIKHKQTSCTFLNNTIFRIQIFTRPDDIENNCIVIIIRNNIVQR